MLAFDYFNFINFNIRHKLICRDVSGVELLMNNHQSLKAEVDAREDNLAACVSLGKELLARQHYAAQDIRDRLLALNNHRHTLLRRWEERWENLQLSNYHIYHL